MIKIALIPLLVIFTFWCGPAFAEPKAEPYQIVFDRGTTNKTVTGKISGSLEHDYSFWARAGQQVDIHITSTPKGKFAAFRLQNPPELPSFATPYDSNTDYTFTAPYTGNYLLYVVFRPAGSVTLAEYQLSVSIK